MDRKNRWIPTAALLAAFPVLFAPAAGSKPTAPARSASRPVRLAEATMIVEVNATEGDAGVQLFLDGDPWDSMTISSPDGRTILDMNTRGRLKGYGLTELFSESSEPPFDVFPLKKFKRLFPEGRYRFVGTDIKGKKVVGKAKLSHDIPDGPKILSPKDGATVTSTNLVASWEPPPEPPGIDIVGYRAIVERENPLRVFSVELPASKTSVTVPQEFLQAATEYLLEVQAIEASGNWTFTEVTFRVS
jgi:Fibronectin type III domain